MFGANGHSKRRKAAGITQVIMLKPMIAYRQRLNHGMKDAIRKRRTRIEALASGRIGVLSMFCDIMTCRCESAKTPFKYIDSGFQGSCGTYRVVVSKIRFKLVWWYVPDMDSFVP